MNNESPSDLIDSAYAWRRLSVLLVLCSIGGVGLWSVVVVLPAIEAEFAIDRGRASIPYLATMIGFGTGGMLMGKLGDRYGIMVPVILGGVMLGIGYITAAWTTSFWQFVLAQSLLVGFIGSSATFAPMMAEASLWFTKRRGIAVAVVASGNYLSGAIWPPLLQYGIDEIGWRQTYEATGVICLITIVPLALLLRRRPPAEPKSTSAVAAPLPKASQPAGPSGTQTLLVIAGFACCVAMSMPQVHIVSYCGDLGFGAQRGAEMLSIMLTFGIVSRLGSGLIADRIGGLGTLIIGSSLQGVALLLYIPFDGLISLYIVSAFFGLVQGGIVPSYALIVREYFPTKEAATRISLVLNATITGMAVGGWMSGEIYDLTGSYQAAFLNGIIWNLTNLSIALWLLYKYRRWRAAFS